MYREIYEELLEWKKDSKMPLMLIGARQTGKTYILDNFCKNNFDNYLYINLDNEENIRNVFLETINPEDIIKKIEIIKEKIIDVENTVIFFDEIQVSERAIHALKYFCESNINYKIVCAGSLLGVKINRFSSSFPVGKVTIKYLYPMNFYEFLRATKQDLLIEEIKKHYKSNEPLIKPIHEKAIEIYKHYLVLGGMPAIINDYIKNDCNIAHTNFNIQNQIITSYLADMSRYTENSESIKNIEIYKSIPKQLAKENNTFMFSVINKDARRSRYESSLFWLLSSNMVIKCDLTSKNESPLKFYADEQKFKLYLSDIGLLRSLVNINYSEILLNKNETFKGVITENYIANEFFPKFKELHYYRFSKYEIDFLININGDIIPVEVKSGVRVSSKSLNEYINKYQPIYSIRISEKNFGMENNIKSVPLYAVFCINNKE